ncbi:MAG: hypothetical protein Q8O61_07295 [Nocardioides sp.]|nr:hypothetical protein [Nocardioides sp.]
MNSHVRRFLRGLSAYAAYVVVAAVLAAPLAVEHAVENAVFEDRVGTFPVRISLSHNGVSTLDTGLIGKLYWERTGTAGFGARVESTGPPEAGGTLSSYLTPAFLAANAAFVEDPDALVRIYSDELGDRLTSAWLRYELVSGLLGGLVLVLLFRGAAPPVPSRLRSVASRSGVRVGYVLVGLAASGLVAVSLFRGWGGTDPVEYSYPMPGVEELSFSSPQTLEVAQQIQPFIDKNAARIEERTNAYVAQAEANLDAELPLHEETLRPLEGERVVVAEADPQGSLVATRVRRHLYPLLREVLGEDALALRTISGDITSNGTVAEEEFVELEATASPDLPTVAVKGDHDTDVTVEQLRDHDLVAPDLTTVEVGGLTVAGAADPAFKSLFGGLVENPSGVSEEELGQALRAVVDPDAAVTVLLHQPRAAAGYLGIASTAALDGSIGRETIPYDDGIPDVPPGIVNIGHLHDAGGPWVIWNTDGSEVTWTVVSQLGTSGGVEESPTFNRFSTPFSVPLKPVSVVLQYVNPDTGLQTGYASIAIGTDGSVTVADRIDVGLPGGEPGPVSEPGLGPDPEATADGTPGN